MAIKQFECTKCGACWASKDNDEKLKECPYCDKKNDKIIRKIWNYEKKK